MMRKYLARLLAFIMVLNLVLCVPVSVGATEETAPVFEADSMEVVTTDEGTQKPLPEAPVDSETPPETPADSETPPETPADSETPPETPAETPAEESGEKHVVIEETVPEATTADGEKVAEQTVTVEVPLEDVLSQTPAGETEPALSEDGTAIDYNAEIDGPEDTVPVSEALDLTAEVTDAQTDQDGNLTDITYEVGLNQQTTVGGGDLGISMNTTETVDPANVAIEPVGAGEYKVKLTVGGMTDDPTRVEHTDHGKTEYFYNAANGKDETDTGKKYFTVASETVSGAVNKVISLVTNFLGTFKVTNDAFEYTQGDKKLTDAGLAEAVEGADNGSTVEMLRDYSTDSTANLSTVSDKQVTVDLNGHQYDRNRSEDVYIDAIYVDSNGSLNLTLQNGKLTSPDCGVTIVSDNNFVTIKNAMVEAEYCPIYVQASENTVTIVDNSTISAADTDGAMAICDYEGSNTYIIKNSTIQSESDNAIYHSGKYGDAEFDISDSKISATGTSAEGVKACTIYISGSAESTGRDGLNNLTLTNTDVTGLGTAVEVKFTNVTVNGGKLVAQETDGSYTPDGNGSCVMGAALVTTDNVDGRTGGTITINSGYFKSAEDMYSIRWAANENAADGDKATVIVNGGRFVYPAGLEDTFIAADHAVMSYNDGSEYAYGVLGLNETPVRPGYTFQGYTHKGAPITLAEAKKIGAVAIAQWEKTPEKAEEPAEDPAPAALAVPEDALIIVQPDSNGNDVEVALQGSTAVVTVSTPAGEEAAVSKVTVTSVPELRELGVDTMQVQVEKDVVLELDVTQDMKESVVVARTEDTLVLSGCGNAEITIHMTELKETADDTLRISLIKGVITISSGETRMFELDVSELIRTNGQLTIRLEGGVLKLYDESGTLVQEIKL